METKHSKHFTGVLTDQDGVRRHFIDGAYGRTDGGPDRIAAGDISRLIVAHKDRLVRFGFDLLDHIAKRSACVIEVVNQESLSPQEEMTEDLLSIVHTFSCRLYGMRKYKRKND